MVNIVLILIVLNPQILSEKRWKYHYQASKFQNFLGGACPQTPYEARAFGARKVGCCLLSQWGRLLQNLLTALSMNSKNNQRRVTGNTVNESLCLTPGEEVEALLVG